jgi:hypothetical protein
MIVNWRNAVRNVVSAGTVGTTLLVWPGGAALVVEAFVTQLGVNVSQAEGVTRLTQFGAAVSQAENVTRLTQFGAAVVQAEGVSRITQFGAATLQASGIIFVTQVGANLITREAPPPECPGEVGPPREDGLPYAPPDLDPCVGPGDKGPPRTGT